MIDVITHSILFSLIAKPNEAIQKGKDIDSVM